jgi:hypothetical protein
MEKTKESVGLKVNIENSLAIRYQARVLGQSGNGSYRLKVSKGDFDGLVAKGRSCTLEFGNSKTRTAVIREVHEEADAFLVTVSKNGIK